MRRLTCFDCPHCNRPFAAEPDLPQSPVLCQDLLGCQECSRENPDAESAAFILNMLASQQLTRSDDDGWRPTGRLLPWQCAYCAQEFSGNGPRKPMLHRCCQRLVCDGCNALGPLRNGCELLNPAVEEGEYLEVVRSYQIAYREANDPLDWDRPDVDELDMESHQYQAAKFLRLMFSRAPPRNLQQPPRKANADAVPRKNGVDAQKIEQNYGIPIEPMQTGPLNVENGPYVLPDRAEVVVKAVDLNETCENCQRSFGTNDLFSCTECDGMTLCGACCFRGHKTHECVELKERKLAELEKTTTEFLSQHYAGLRGNIQGVHAEIEHAQKELVQACEETLKLVPGQTDYGIGARICAELRATADDFEKCFEAYLPHARMYGTNLLNLKDKVHKFVGELEKSNNGDWWMVFK